MKRKLLTFFFIFSIAAGFATDSTSIKKRTIAILDLTARNMEANDGELFSAKHILKVAGLPFIVTTSVNTAMKYGIVIPSSRLTDSVFTSPEYDSIHSYVNNGGILISAGVRDSAFLPLFGINTATSSSSHHRIIFNMALADLSMRWLNDTMEQTISIGKLTYPTTITVRQYTLGSGIEMAHYDDNSTAITRNNYGAGIAYGLGFSFKNLVLLNQVNKDADAQRIYSNGFEPTTDALILFLKAICTKHTPNTVWLHTSPFESKTTLMVTHDVDATTAYDTMSYYADYENSINLSTTYTITTHYINDGVLSDFYNVSSIPQVQYLINKGHKLASHSVGHFTDFYDDAIFPLGVMGNTASSYLPFNSGMGPTTGGTVLGETEVSKNILEADLGVPIRTFRAGHLCYNKYLVNALDTLGYEYCTNYAAGDVLTSFPYLNHKDRSSSGAISNVWEIPLNISDVFTSDPISFTNYSAKQAIWLDVINRNRANYAPNNLLIHPNRIYKLWAQQDLIDQLPPDVFTTDLETFADYWRGRDSIRFTTELSNDTLTITVPSSQLPLNNMMSFVVDNGQDLTLIKAQDEFGSPIAVIQSLWDDNGIILHFGYFPPLSVAWKENPIQSGLLANCFPNPFTSTTTVEIWFKEDAALTIELYNVMGQLIQTTQTGDLQAGIYRHTVEANQLPAGTYFCKISTEKKSMVKKIVLMEK